MATETATSRLTRLLTMVPWLVNRQGIELEEAARGLGVTVEQLESDLNLLFLCGYGQMPDELIEADWEEGRVFVGNADTISRPLRLGVDEAVTLIVGLRTLLDVPGLTERDAIERALAKLEAAAGRVDPRIDPGADPVRDDGGRFRAVLDRGVREQRQLRLSYYVPSRDERSDRTVDPRGVVHAHGHDYLDAYCHSAEAPRLFRLDRIQAVDLLESPVVVASEGPRDLAEGLFTRSDRLTLATLRLAPPARWVVEYHPVEDVRRLADGDLEVDFLVADERWLRRLLLRVAPHASVVGPAELAAGFSAVAEQTLSLYAGSGVD